jgi:DNA-binding transcriptional LysR family regulator
MPDSGTKAESLGVRLLSRTTRSVAATEAGDQLLAQVGPALGEISIALDGVVTSRRGCRP